ncbi:MAG: MBL fold metallo-hydrolase [Treponema sp.]|nr:MBL fold metallo-hydrolase [Treponema sp.]
MKVYFHLNLESFSNCYFVVNELSKQAIIIDPGKINEQIIKQVEDGNLKLAAALITHNHMSHMNGLKTLKKIYDVEVYAADAEIAEKPSHVLKGDGSLTIAGMNVSYYSVPGHSADSIVFKIGNVLFTGDTLEAGIIGTTNNNYAKKTLVSGIRTKLYAQHDDTIVMPGHGPMSSIGAERMFNIDTETRKS